jgi:hypothetical protein
MKAYSAYNDDGITVMVMASNKKQAVKKTVEKIAEIGLEIDPDFFEDDINDSYVSDDETVNVWLTRNGVKFTENNMLVMEMNDIEQSVQIINL